MSAKRSIGDTNGDDENAYRQLTPKNNLQLISPKLTSSSAKDKDAEEGTLTALYGSVVELARAANKRSNRMQVIKCDLKIIIHIKINNYGLILADDEFTGKSNCALIWNGIGIFSHHVAFTNKRGRSVAVEFGTSFVVW